MSVSEAYDFSQDWFSYCLPTWRKVLAQLRPTRLMEIGCYEGRSTSYLIERCSEFGPLHINCVDTWEGSVDLPSARMAGVEQRFDRNVRLAIARAHAPVSLRKLKQPSAIALAGLVAARAKPFDLIYIDGSHTAPDVLIDAVLAFQLLRKGGMLVFDDYLWSMEPPLETDPLNMPKLAVDVFTTVFARKVKLLAGIPNSQCFAEKISN